MCKCTEKRVSENMAQSFTWFSVDGGIKDEGGWSGRDRQGWRHWDQVTEALAIMLRYRLGLVLVFSPIGLRQ